MKRLEKLFEAYNNAPEIFHATRYWKNSVIEIIKEIQKADLSKMRSGQYPIFAKFGFGEYVYKNPYKSFPKKITFDIIHPFITKLPLPYSIKLSDIREMAFKHCIDTGKLTNAIPITEIETSTFGAPADLFEMQGKKYTISFLNKYLRYCFAQKYIGFKGNETIVELGSGSGHQVEVLKKLYPHLTILCFDLPGPLFLCEEYLTKALGERSVVGAEIILNFADLSFIEKGKVYMFGNWQFPLLKNYDFDIFWNAASFGEMEPHVVKNYLSYVSDNASFIYLLQAKKGKESFINAGVEKPITFEDYNKMLPEYRLLHDEDAYSAHMKINESGGYFQAVWKKIT
jgi:putative sugar O-methyltransferase